MNDTAIYRVAERNFTDQALEYHFSVLFSFPENEWFFPNNKENEAYSICRCLSDIGLIAIIRIPIYKNGTISGVKTGFYYNKSMKYESN